MKVACLKTVALCMMCALLFSSCASMMPDPGSITTEEDRIAARNKCILMYTAGGALSGAVVGALTGGGWKSAGVGAAVGGGIGFAYAWGKCLSLYSTLKSQQVAGYAETAKQTNYNASQGNVTKIQDFSVTPNAVQPGSSVKLDGSYYVMAPEGAKEMKVSESRTVKYFDTTKNQFVDLGQVEQEITAAPGIRKADGAFDIPNDVPEGRYKIAFKVASGGKEDVMEKELTVKKGTVMNQMYLFAYSLDR
jgi:hypothetical protein